MLNRSHTFCNCSSLFSLQQRYKYLTRLSWHTKEKGKEEKRCLIFYLVQDPSASRCLHGLGPGNGSAVIRLSWGLAAMQLEKTVLTCVGSSGEYDFPSLHFMVQITYIYVLLKQIARMKKINLFFFKSIPVAYGNSWPRGWIGAAAASLSHSHSNAESQHICDLHCHLKQQNEWGQEWTCNLKDTILGS